MRNYKGGYALISLHGVDLTGENIVIAGLYQALTKSFLKRVVLCDVVINDEKQNEIGITVTAVDGDLVIDDVYGYKLTVTDEDAVTVSEVTDDIKSIVEDLVEGGTLDNAKPIFFHPIRIESSSSKFRLVGTILNNSNAALTGEDTTNLLTFIRNVITEQSLTKFDFLVSGGLIVDNTSVNPYLIRVTSSTAILAYMKSDGTSANIDFEAVSDAYVVDEVNKIN